MAAKRRSLGKGLDALLSGSATGTPSASEAASGQEGEAGADSGIREIPVELIERGRYQPRRDFDPEALQELADSIIAQGLMQPIVLRPIGEQRYEIIAGERRWRAAQLAGLAAIPAVVRDVDDEAAIAMALIENIQREDLTSRRRPR
jgi:ParB family chromosome partitioning protein